MDKLETLSIQDLKTYLYTENLDILHKLKTELDDIYYNTGNSTLEDQRYDMLKDVLKKRDPNYIIPVGAKLREGENRTRIPFWLGSADKITPEEPKILEKWLSDNKSPYIISEKLDGVSCLLVNKNNKINLYTRGDGHIGADISYLVPYFNLPKNLPDIVVRGELIISKEVFETKYKDKNVNGRVYRNPRNMVSGLVGAKTARQGLTDINFITYEIISSNMLPNIQLSELEILNFSVVKYENVENLSMELLSEKFISFKEKSEYDLDGIIVISDNLYTRNTSGNPSYMFAFKMLTDDAIHTTEVLSVEWNISKWGQLKPVVIVKPVVLKDITIQRATAHNAKYIKDNSLGKGAIIKITRSKDVIPYILYVVKPSNPEYPEIPFTWDKNEVNIFATNLDNVMCIKLIAGIFEKLGIKHVSEATVSKMFENDLDDFIKIIKADKAKLSKIPGFHEKSVDRIYTNIHNGLQNVKLPTFLGASGIFGFGIGRKRIESLLQEVPDLLELDKKTAKVKIMKVQGFSDKTADKVANNLQYAVKLIRLTDGYITFKEGEKKSNELQGKKFVMSGFRSKELEELIVSKGGKVTTSVSKQTSGVIIANAGEKSSGKVKKAIELGVPIILKEDFEKNL